MSIRIREVSDLGAVSFQKHRGSRSIKIHIQGSKIKVTLPSGVPYIIAEKYLLTKKDWVLRNLSKEVTITNGSFIGKNHQIVFLEKATDKLSTRVTSNKIIVYIGANTTTSSAENQSIIRSACERALKKETQEIILPRLQDMALENGFFVKNVFAKKLRSHWGSCDSHKNIILNIFLAQLPWRLIEYVMVHELAHTKHLNHSPNFWQEVELLLPDYKTRRKEIKAFSPDIINS
jgi:predicted metal-dependent hydrolase